MRTRTRINPWWFFGPFVLFLGLLAAVYGQTVATPVPVRPSAEVFVHEAATGGVGTSGDPWTGWDTAITWAAHKRYKLKPGWYSYSTSPNFGLAGLELIAEPGAYLRHTGTGNALIFDAGSGEGTDWTQGLRVEGVQVYGNPTALTGTLSVSNGGTAVTGSGTAFTTEIEVGDSITFAAGQSTARSYVVSVITDDTNLTINRTASQAESGQAAKVTKTRYGFYLRGIRNSSFDRCRAHDVVTAGMWTEACVTNSLRLFRVTNNTPSDGEAFNCRPQYGIVTTGRGADHSTTWTIEEPVIEGPQIYGIWFKTDSYGNTVINGTSEGNPGIGIQLDGPRNALIGIDVEANTGNDIVVNSAYNSLVNVMSFGTVTVTSSGAHATFIGGYYQTLTINSSAYRARLFGAFVNGTLTDSGNETTYIRKTTSDLTSAIGIPRPVEASITASGSMATNVLLANLFTISTSTNCTLNAPSNAFNGCEITYRFDNNSGSQKTISWNAVFEATTQNALPATIEHQKTIYVTARYSSFWTKWQVTNVASN